MSGKLTLILGGARSGKSAYAQALAARAPGPVLYVATAEALDAEMIARITAHRAERPAAWQTLEAPRRLGPAILATLQAHAAKLVLVDCLTLLASNVVAPLPEPVTAESAEAALEAEVDGLLEAYRASQADWLVVSNEVGLGLVPPYPLGRAYRDALGRANQRLAAVAGTVVFMVAGLPMVIKAA